MDMEPRRAGVESGWGWLVCGWRLFMKSPAIWIVIIILYAVVTVVLNIIPLVGGLASALIAPALTGGMLYGCQQLEKDQPLEIAHLFQAFRDTWRTTPMLILGVISLVVAVVGVLLGGGLMVGGLFGAHMAGGAMDPTTVNPLTGVGLLGLLVILAINIGLMMALFYATPLVMLNLVSPVEALKTSITASLGNIVPLTVLGLIVLVLSVLAALPLGLGFLVLGPVMMGTVYCSYREVFPDETPNEPPSEQPGAIPPPPPPAG